MDDSIFYKIIEDLKNIPLSHQFYMTLARINEPLLDKRLKTFSEYIDTMLPNADQIFWSNGSTLIEGKFEWMGSMKNATLVVSLNSIDEQKHKDLMGFGLERIIRNLDYAHQLKAKGAFPANVILNAPHHSEMISIEFINYCKRKWPLFNPNILPFFKWQGDIAAGEKERDSSPLSEYIGGSISNIGCGQWFDLHILANGQITKCCIDEAGHKSQSFSVKMNNALELYQQSQKLRDVTPARKQVQSCESCTHMG